MRVEVEIESSSRPGVIHKVWLGDPPTCSCEAFQYGYRICRHIRQARIRVYKEQKGKPDSAFRSIATAPTESPEPHKDDSLRIDLRPDLIADDAQLLTAVRTPGCHRLDVHRLAVEVGQRERLTALGVRQWQVVPGRTLGGRGGAHRSSRRGRA